jgi:diadenosine tetraphosphate (Ap4A) HIT family hydrolase
MIVPLKHTNTLSDLTADESIEFVGLLASYESKGFNVYARAPHSTMKTVEHQHTHLIKPSTKKTKLLLYIRKPYIRLIKH